MNEGIYRSPKWLRNVADFEINTGDDIKGEPSKRKQKKLDDESKRLRDIEKEKDEKIFDLLNPLVMKYIINNYKSCDISIESGNIRIKKNGISYDNIELKFDLLLKTAIVKPTFILNIKYGTKIFNYEISGLSYSDIKNYIINTIYPWYKISNNYNKSSKTYYSDDYDDYEYDDWDKYKQEKYTKTDGAESSEIKSKRNIYNKLIATLDSFNKEYDKIKAWKKVNPGKVHNDEEVTLNQIKTVKDKISKIKTKYKFEGYQCTHFKNFYDML